VLPALASAGGMVRLGKAAIFAAVRPGTRRCRGQREHRRRGFELIDAQPWNAQRKAHYKTIFKRLSAFMDWGDRTTRPTHEVLRGPHRPGCRGPHKPGCRRPLGGCRCGERCGCPGRVSSDTVGRAIAWFHEVGLLGLVSPGVRADMRPWLHADEGNLAAVYVCTVPRRRKRQLPRADAGQGEIADLSGFCKKTDLAPRASTGQKTEAARAARGLTLLPRGGTGVLHTVPENRSEGLAAARAVQDRSVWLRELSAEHVHHLARVYFAAGWTGADVLYALDHEATGRPHGYAHAVRHPAAWARARLALWLGPDGRPVRSASQVRAGRAAADRAAQEARRRERAAAAARAVDAAAAGLADAARAAIAAASPAAERALAKARALARRRAGPGAPRQPATPPAAPPAPDGAPADVAALRQALLARLDAAGLIQAQRHRARTAARLAGPGQAAAVRAETAPLIAAAVAAEAARQRQHEHELTPKPGH
jgi:hypothetical protein